MTPLTFIYQIFSFICSSFAIFFSKQNKSLFRISMNFIFIIIIVEMKNAKKFLKENLTESKAIAVRIFNVNVNSLITFIKRDSDQKNEDQNKILQNHEINVFDDFIRSLLKHEILSTSEIVFSAIVRLKRAYRRSTSSKR